MSIREGADWLTEFPDGVICGTETKEYSRRSKGIRWCFFHRRRHEFWYVFFAPVGLSYYGPHLEIHGETDGCTDLFPGWEYAEVSE